MHVLDANGATVGFAHDLEHFTQGRLFFTGHAGERVQIKRAVEVFFGKAVGFVIQFPVIAGANNAQRIELGMQMAAHPVGPDEDTGADRFLGDLGNLVAGYLRFFTGRNRCRVAGDITTVIVLPDDRRFRPGPTGAVNLAFNTRFIVIEFGENGYPAGVH